MFQRKRNQNVLDLLELSLLRYRETQEPKHIVDILYAANQNGFAYDVDTIDALLDQFHQLRNAAIAIYDELYPPSPKEARQQRNARRRYVKQSGIIA